MDRRGCFRRNFNHLPIPHIRFIAMSGRVKRAHALPACRESCKALLGHLWHGMYPELLEARMFCQRREPSPKPYVITETPKAKMCKPATLVSLYAAGYLR